MSAWATSSATPPPVSYCQDPRNIAYYISTMSLIHITSHSIRQLLSLTEKKDELLQGIEEVHAEIIRTLKGGVVGVVEIITSQPAIARPAPAAKPVAVAPSKTVKPAKAKRT
ncbi:MAG: hypothetical protein WCI20_14495, partial [bacterium]